ncbi:tetratricopeptide repeat-containing sulfotransferase family protein [Saliniradius amylolyticus]|nr:sulfotransferase [Saliniradius amylolyticus]
MTNIEQLHKAALDFINQGRLKQAHAVCRDIIQHDPGHADAHFLMGVINYELGQIKKSIALMIEAVKRDPKVEYQAHLAKAFAINGDLVAARKVCDANAPTTADSALTADTFGVALSKIGLHNRALTYFENAISKAPENASYHYNYAVSAKFLGDFEAARQGFEKAINLKPDYVQAHYALADLGDVDNHHNHIPRMEALWSGVSDPNARLQLAHGLAKEYEACGRYDDAFKVLQSAKSQKLAQTGDSAQSQKALFECCYELMSAPQIPSGCESDEPIFVLGMPRSGTTLVDRILCSHSQVMSAGELQDFGMAIKELTTTPSNHVLDAQTLQAAYQCDPKAIGQRYLDRTRSVTAGSSRFIDKLPFNFFYLDLILRALPNAKVLCLIRDPMDTCIGNFRQLFSLNSPYYHYSLDLMNTGQLYAQFYRWVHHFEQQGHNNFRLVNYEALARDPEPHIRDIIEFCDLPWQDACLNVEQNTAPVSTASKVQVREPINTKSIGRWKRYQPHTEPLERFFTEQGIAYDL